jgi:hypothetical protein
VELLKRHGLFKEDDAPSPLRAASSPTPHLNGNGRPAELTREEAKLALIAWCRARGLNPRRVHELGVGLEEDPANGWCAVWPMHRYDGQEPPRRLLRLSDGGWRSHGQTKGAALVLGDFGSAHLVLVTEGESDALAAWTLLAEREAEGGGIQEAIAVLGLPGASMVPPDLPDWVGSRLVVLATDADDPGDCCAASCAALLEAAQSGRTLRLRPSVPGVERPDLRDLVAHLRAVEDDPVGAFLDLLAEAPAAAASENGPPAPEQESSADGSDVVSEASDSIEVLERAGFRRLDVAQMLAEPSPPRDDLWEGLVEHGELVWLSGRGKTGKSMLALFLACASLAGREAFLGLPIGQLDWVVYLDAENRERIVRRRLHFARVPAGVADRLDYFSLRGADLGSAEGLVALNLVLGRHGRGLVILDSLVALHRADEDKATEVRWFVDGIRRVAESHDPPVTVVGLAHENRQGNTRGSLDWRNAVDTVLELQKDDAGLRTLTIADRRDGAEDVPPRVFRFAIDAGVLTIETSAQAVERPSAVERMVEQLVPVLRGRLGISRAEAARAVGTTRDHGTFRAAWPLAQEHLQASLTGAGGQ